MTSYLQHLQDRQLFTAEALFLPHPSSSLNSQKTSRPLSALAAQPHPSWLSYHITDLESVHHHPPAPLPSLSQPPCCAHTTDVRGLLHFTGEVQRRQSPWVTQPDSSRPGEGIQGIFVCNILIAEGRGGRSMVNEALGTSRTRHDIPGGQVTQQEWGALWGLTECQILTSPCTFQRGYNE